MYNEPAAIDADATKTGVTHNSRFETLAADMHGYGENDARKPSTVRPSLPEGKYAADCDPYVPRDSATGLPLADPDTGQRAQPYDEALAHGDVVALERADEIAQAREDRTPIEQLMAQAPTGAHGHSSSKSGRRYTTPMKSPVCEICHLEDCTHLAKGRRGRRPRVEIDGIFGRSAKIAFKVSAPAKSALQSAGIDGALIDELGFAIQNGVTLAKVRSFLQTAAPPQPDAA